MNPTPPPPSGNAAPPPAPSGAWPAPLGDEGNGIYRVLRGGQRKLVERLRDGVRDPGHAQAVRLRALLAASHGSAFDREHGLSSVRTLADLQQAVPVRTHSDLEPWLTRVAGGEPDVLTRERVVSLLETSGTTGSPKLLPVTASWARVVSEIQTLWVLGLVRDHPKAATGRALTVVSPARHGTSVGGLAIGSNTGRIQGTQPWLVRRRLAIPATVFQIADTDARHYAILRFALQSPVTTITTASPSTVLLLCRRMVTWWDELVADTTAGTLSRGPSDRIPRRTRLSLRRHLRKRAVTGPPLPAEQWDLAAVNCWTGGPMGWFAERLPAALGGPVPVRELGVTASEGSIAFPCAQAWPGSLVYPHGHLVEFVDDSGQARGMAGLEVGEELRVVLSTEAGLWRYDLQDRVEVVGHCEATPMIRFLGKAGRFLNGLGERVTEAQVSAAVAALMREQPAWSDAVGCVARVEPGEVPRHVLAIEPGSARTAEPAAAAAAFDRALRGLNVEYDSKRSSHRLGPAAVEMLPRGTFAAWRQARLDEGAPDGQLKDPVAAIDAAEWARIEHAATRARTS